jgi:uncharacterized membrane protein HdeD (DUF308 family)
MLQIVLGSISTVLAAVILFIPGSSISATVLLLSLTLLVIGIERICFGVARPTATTTSTTTTTAKLFKYKSSSIANIAIGLLVVSLSIVLMEFPIFSAAIGIGRIIYAFREQDIHRGTRKYLSVGVGILCIAVGILIISNPATFGLMLLVFMLSITLIIVSISMIVRGLKGETHVARKNF